MAKAFVFKNPQLTVNNLTQSTSTVVGEENFAEDGITLTIESSPREIARFTGTDRQATGIYDVTGTVASILEGDDIWKLIDTFKIAGMVTSTLANGTVGVQVGGGNVCASQDELELILEDKCRAEADVQKRIKLTSVSFNAESLELALNNSDGLTPEFQFYAGADASGAKAFLGFDDSASA